MQFKKPAPRWNTHNHNQNHIPRFLCSCWQQRKTRNRRLLGLGLLLVCAIVVFFTTRHGYASIQDNNKNNNNNKDTTINKNNKIPSSTTTTTMKKPKIIYVPIPESDTGVLRFAAQKQVLQQPSNDDDGRKIMSPVTIQEWANLMAHEDRIYAQELALDLTTVLKDAPYDAFRFETKGVTAQNAKTKPFEFVLVGDSYLARFASSADPTAFAEYLQCPSSSSSSSSSDGANGCVFENLGGDALLVAPKPLLHGGGDGTSVYGHCASFVRKAPREQIVGMWRLVAKTLVQRLEEHNTNYHPQQPVWLSTAGTGVAWLHFRFDDRPKYYLYQPFADEH